MLNKIITRTQTDSRMVKVTSLTAEGNCQFSKIQRRYMFIHIIIKLSLSKWSFKTIAAQNKAIVVPTEWFI